MNKRAVQYTCVTCGVCCKGRLVPLTLKEAEHWLTRGHDVAIVLEAFSVVSQEHASAQYLHNAGRAATVKSGDGQMNVIAVFTGNALTQCPHLQDDNLCGIYQERPLVCRIYPLEINPFIELRAENKICPPESWDSGEIICTDGVTKPPMQALISQSRQADIDDATAKVAICEALGMNVASWKGDGLAVYFPARQALLSAIDANDSRHRASEHPWQVRTDNDTVADELLKAGVQRAVEGDSNYLYQAL